ncbi:MAG: 4'-phosphopantetheinyl transferase superfamily protein [Candidatus Riflebacteria bacterium]|nr:4'-phosphopantetheinyl transferase superfamily protein [Candidatus Riflebacteria bacterium]
MNVIEIRHADLRLEEPELEALRRLLSDDELDRCSRAKFPTVERRFLAARGLLRRILGETLRCDPRELSFAEETGGKPFVAGSGAPPPVRYSVSHSADLLVVGISRDFEIGIDVEKIRENYQPEPIVKRFFSAREYEVWQGFPENERIEAFFRAWTRKEAYLKGTGKGITGIGEIEVSFERGLRKALVKHVHHTQESERWDFIDLDEFAGFVGCIAAPVQIDRLDIRPV